MSRRYTHSMTTTWYPPMATLGCRGFRGRSKKENLRKGDPPVFVRVLVLNGLQLIVNRDVEKC